MGLFDDILDTVGGFAGDVYGAFEDAFNPGADEANAAVAQDKAARDLWMRQFGQEPVLDAQGQPVVDKNGNPVTRPKIDPLLTAADMQAPELQDYTAQQVVYEDPGASSYSTQLGAPTEYFRELTQAGGRDAQAEADYARRVSDAERARRARTDAAVAQLETQGRSGSGASLLAGLNASNASASDAYQAGLDANAQAQMRRDGAAQQWGNLATTQAQGMDAWDQWSQDLRYDISESNADRRQDVNTKNVTQANQTEWWNRVGSKQQAQDYQTQGLAGATNQYGNVADAYREKGASQPALGPWGVETLLDVGKAAAGGA